MSWRGLLVSALAGASLLAVQALAGPVSAAGQAACGVQANLTVTVAMVQELVNRIQNTILTVKALDPDGHQYYPLIAGLVRLAFHACAARQCGSYVDLNITSNNGLAPVVTVLGKIWNSLDYRWSGFSKADLYALAGIAAFEVATDFQQSVVFRYGRTDYCPSQIASLGVELPKRTFGTNETLDYFARMFGFSEAEAVAIMGAHSLGVVRDLVTARPLAKWLNDPDTISNNYYVDLLQSDWRQVARSYTGLPYKQTEWQKPTTTKRVMLNCDMSLVIDINVVNATTGSSSCSLATCKKSRVASIVQRYSADFLLFVNDFAGAFGKLIENGWTGQLTEVQP